MKKEIEKLEEAINQAFKDETDTARIEQLGAIKAALNDTKVAVDKQDETLTKMTEKVRDLLLTGGNFARKEDETETGVTYEDCLTKVLGEKNE